MSKKKKCAFCNEEFIAKNRDVQFCSNECFEQAEYQEIENIEYENGPTGHGDICMSDADPGL